MKSKIITGIDIGTSKISVLVCNLKSVDNIEILGIGTSILKGVQSGIIKDKALFNSAFQNCIKRAQTTSGEIIEDVFINVPNGQKRFIIETGIVQNHTKKLFSTVDTEEAMKKSIHCIEKKGQSILHLVPINQRLDGQTSTQLKKKQFTNLEIDTGIILCNTANLSHIISAGKHLGLKIKGIISDYLSIGSALITKLAHQNYLIIDFGAQVTSICIYNQQLKFAHTIHIGSEQISKDLSICLKCSISEAERIKILYGHLKNYHNEYSKHITVQCHNGQKEVNLTTISSIIESRVNQLFQIIQKYLINAPNFDEIIITGSGSNLKGFPDWVESKFSKPINKNVEQLYKEANINSNYMIAMGQIVHGYQIGLLKSHKIPFISKISNQFFKQ